MKIAFIHYHLKTGGVTSVLKQQTEAIRDVCDVLVLAGEVPDTSFPFDTVEIPGLAYDKEGVKAHEPEKAAEAVTEAIFSKWKHGCDILHVHNSMLAKNKNFLKILKRLQKHGIRLFLQIHDFAEDGRPLAYFPDEYVSDCHYGVINSRDYNILLKSGLKKEGLHHIPNTVNFFDFGHKDTTPENLILYPVRAIRRKNIGEAILLSLFFRNNETLGITQPPNSPADITPYNDWKDYVKENHLNVMFEAGVKRDFEGLVQSSKFVITTSISEGFGFSFLEPWTAKKMLWGRNISDICCDFERNRVQLNHLYTQLNVPLQWITINRFYEKWKSCVLQACERFDYRISEECIRKAFDSLTKHGLIDFALLDEAFQKQIISRILSDNKEAHTLIRLNPYLSTPGDVSDNASLIQNNMSAVRSNYNQAEYKKNLMDIYSRIVRDSVSQRIDKNILLSQFFNLEEFSLLKWGDYVG
ncbi:hypothetical protein [Desulfonema magnum]|uniref:Glycosyltransferase family 1 protein n=1 Tax=Desulfonema magnum TaxID=45655 RepID=A0A975GQ15_9BACT|nr:hypothetical protein [Desulfonema magnum]QTA89576.1 Uncharacterized protein dnm_056320 [Desulfonema magnum]